jgi:hypothetical protein
VGAEVRRVHALHFIRFGVAGAYLWVLDQHTGMQRALSRLLAGPEVH